MATIERKTVNGTVSGTFDSKFAGVADAFIDNFETRGEVGASVARRTRRDLACGHR